MTPLDAATEAAAKAAEDHYTQGTGNFTHGRYLRDALRIGLRGYRAARLAQGWREVPREPTRAMTMAAWTARTMAQTEEAALRAAWDAAPDPAEIEDAR